MSQFNIGDNFYDENGVWNIITHIDKKDPSMGINNTFYFHESLDGRSGVSKDTSYWNKTKKNQIDLNSFKEYSRSEFSLQQSYDYFDLPKLDTMSDEELLNHRKQFYENEFNNAYEDFKVKENNIKKLFPEYQRSDKLNDLFDNINNLNKSFESPNTIFQDNEHNQNVNNKWNNMLDEAYDYNVKYDNDKRYYGQVQNKQEKAYRDRVDTIKRKEEREYEFQQQIKAEMELNNPAEPQTVKEKIVRNKENRRRGSDVGVPGRIENRRRIKAEKLRPEKERLYKDLFDEQILGGEKSNTLNINNQMESQGFGNVVDGKYTVNLESLDKLETTKPKQKQMRYRFADPNQNIDDWRLGKGELYRNTDFGETKLRYDPTTLKKNSLSGGKGEVAATSISEAVESRAKQKSKIGVAGVGLNAFFTYQTYKESRREGNGVLKSTAKAGMDFALGEALGAWMLPYSLAKSAPQAIINTVESVNKMSRDMNSTKRFSTFDGVSFQDTQQMATMRQSGMEMAKMSQYNLQQTLMGNEAQYLHK